MRLNKRQNALFRSNGGGFSLDTGLSFYAPLNDAGAGVVNTTLARGTGSATFTRATSATCWSSAGLLLTVGTGIPRYTYTELTGTTGLGYLCEEARTNEVLWNRDLTNAAWTKVNITAAKDQTGIDGAASAASSLVSTLANGTVLQIITEASAARSFSVYMKRITGTGEIDITENGGTAWTDVTSLINSSTWTRVSLLNASVLNPSVGFRIVTSGDKIAVDYVQNELGTFITTPIATTTVAVTRNIDALSYPGTNNVTNTVGTAYAEATLTSGIGTTQGSILQTDAAGSGRALEKQAGQAATTVAIYDGTSTLIKAGITDLSAGVPVKLASTWTGTTQNVGQTSIALASGAFDGTMGDGSKISVGISGLGGNAMNGTMRNVKIWNRVLTAAQITGL